MFGRTGGTRTHRLLTLIQQGIPIPCHCPVIIWRGAKDLNLDLSALDLLSVLQYCTNSPKLVPVVGVEPTLCRFWVYRLCQLGYTGINLSANVSDAYCDKWIDFGVFLTNRLSFFLLIAPIEKLSGMFQFRATFHRNRESCCQAQTGKMVEMLVSLQPCMSQVWCRNCQSCT